MEREWKPIEEFAGENSLLIAVLEGFISLDDGVAELLADPSRDKMPYNSTQITALYALYAEAHLGRLLVEYKKQAIDTNRGTTVPGCVGKKLAEEAISLYEHEEFITEAFEDAVMNDQVVTWKMVMSKV